MPCPEKAFSVASPCQPSFPSGLSKMETSHGEDKLELVMEWIPGKS